MLVRFSLPLRSFLFACLLAAATSAGTLIVPDDQPDLPSAIAAASSGDLILIRTTEPQNFNASVVVDKPLTIAGDPLCFLSNTAPGIQLAGPGAGEVVFVNVQITVSGDYMGMPSLYGGGFDAVHFVGCVIRHDNEALSGTDYSSYPAIDLPTVQYMTVVDCDLKGGHGGTDNCAGGGAFPNGREGIYAPSASVLILDSTVTGADGSRSIPEYARQPCPSDLSTWGGKGGDGVVAAEVHAWGSTVNGGLGTFWKAWSDGLSCAGTLTDCGQQPDGVPFNVSGVLEVNGCNRLAQSTSRIQLGSTWTLTWDPLTANCSPNGSGCGGACAAALYISFSSPVAPYPVGVGYGFLEPTDTYYLFSFPSTYQLQLGLPVPTSLGLTGLPVVTQVLLSDGELSGPTSAALVP